jgi:hypothetical protein
LNALHRATATRTIPDLWDAIRDVIAQFTLDERRNYFAAAGYEQDMMHPDRKAL